jgi:hypothetical protein
MKDNVVSAASPTARELYLTLTKNLRAFGPFEVELKKSSVHLVRTSAFCGVRFRQQYLLVTIKSAAPMKIDEQGCQTFIAMECGTRVYALCQGGMEQRLEALPEIHGRHHVEASHRRQASDARTCA